MQQVRSLFTVYFLPAPDNSGNSEDDVSTSHVRVKTARYHGDLWLQMQGASLVGLSSRVNTTEEIRGHTGARVSMPRLGLDLKLLRKWVWSSLGTPSN